MERAKRLSAIIGIGTVGFGLWAFLSPSSFFDFATYPPYSKHFVHDAGAFMIGLGAVLLLAAAGRNGLVVALGGNAVGAWFHFGSHLIDRGIGGGSWRDPVLTLVLAAVLTAGAARASKHDKQEVRT